MKCLFEQLWKVSVIKCKSSLKFQLNEWLNCLQVWSILPRHDAWLIFFTTSNTPWNYSSNVPRSKRIVMNNLSKDMNFTIFHPPSWQTVVLLNLHHKSPFLHLYIRHTWKWMEYIADDLHACLRDEDKASFGQSWQLDLIQHMRSK